VKVIFLDVDGVLNSNDYMDYTLKNNIKGILEDVDPQKIEMLKYALNITGAQIVVSSSWRNIRKFEDLKSLFLRYDIKLDEKTPLIGNNRGLEIKEYLKEHNNIEQYLILDDEMFDSFDEELISNLILTKEDSNDNSYGNGLQLKHIKQIIDRFGKVEKKKLEHDDER
jgi:hypothetical protein